jgi:hypothetical protein
VSKVSLDVQTHITNVCVVSCFLETKLSIEDAAGLARAPVTSAITTSLSLDPDPGSLVTDSLVEGNLFSETASLATDSRGVVDTLGSGRRPSFNSLDLSTGRSLTGEADR